MRERTRLDKGINGYLAIEHALDDTLGLAEMADAEGDQAMLDDAQRSLEALQKDVRARELDSLLSGEADRQ